MLIYCPPCEGRRRARAWRHRPSSGGMPAVGEVDPPNVRVAGEQSRVFITRCLPLQTKDDCYWLAARWVMAKRQARLGNRAASCPTRVDYFTRHCRKTSPSERVRSLGSDAVIGHSMLMGVAACRHTGLIPLQCLRSRSLAGDTMRRRLILSALAANININICSIELKWDGKITKIWYDNEMRWKRITVWNGGDL